MAAVTRTEPASIIASFANRYTSQMRADTQHYKPFWFLDSVFVGLWVTESMPVKPFGVLDLVCCSMTDKDRFASPFDDDLETKIRPHFHVPISSITLTFLPSGMVVRSSSTLAWAKTSADADMLTRKSRDDNTGQFSVSPGRLCMADKLCNSPTTVAFAPAAASKPILPATK